MWLAHLVPLAFADDHVDDHCPATPAHIVGTCSGCSPLIAEISDAGFTITPHEQREVERCTRGDERSALRCVAETRALPDELNAWLSRHLEQLHHPEDPKRTAKVRKWTQCSARITQLDHHPELCASIDEVSLERARKRGPGKLRLDLSFENACPRDLVCAATVSAVRSAPASDGATTVQQVDLEAASRSRVPVKLRFPGRPATELEAWSLEALSCAYAAPLELSAAADTATADAEVGDAKKASP